MGRDRGRHPAGGGQGGAADRPAGRVAVDYSARVAARWGGSVDLVFIDGDHSEAGARADWEGWRPFVEPGGAVVFHDARLTQEGGRGLPGPTAVVDALFRGPGAVAGWAIAREADRTVAVVREASGGDAVPGR
jgi:hypothetical protein